MGQSSLVSRIGVGIEQAMQVNDEIAHVRIVNRLLSLAFPGGISGGVVGINADDLKLVEVPEFVAVEVAQFATKDQMQQLPLWLVSHRSSPPLIRKCRREAS